MFSEADAQKRIHSEIESLLRIHPETPLPFSGLSSRVATTAYWGYMNLPGRTKNVPNSLFDKMLQYPKTETYLTALLGLAERSADVHQEWHYYQRVIDECIPSQMVHHLGIGGHTKRC